MNVRNVTLDDLRGQTAEEVITEVAAREEILTVTLPDGKTIAIRPSPDLEPLPLIRNGRIAEGWKDAIYDHSQ
ncbi:MAG: hypothetical protein FJ291_10885 [Planctomycetes bacterium]|nr:hypothetical protein [Planctomycetota bacterium]